MQPKHTYRYSYRLTISKFGILAYFTINPLYTAFAKKKKMERQSKRGLDWYHIFANLGYVRYEQSGPSTLCRFHTADPMWQQIQLNMEILLKQSFRYESTGQYTMYL